VYKRRALPGQCNVTLNNPTKRRTIFGETDVVRVQVDEM